FSVSALVLFIFASSRFQKQLNRVVFLFASERAVQFCVVDVQATVDHPLYYCYYRAPRPVLSAVTSIWINASHVTLKKNQDGRQMKGLKSLKLADRRRCTAS
uniref:Secreted protein n=1 Tax=Romanomermis culicivorax TaxID=13658 RepID=A0A915JFB0_ROMCU